ncbi:hypothetical protein pb186bvf_005028 [Paramecium bursaria]
MQEIQDAFQYKAKSNDRNLSPYKNRQFLKNLKTSLQLLMFPKSSKENSFEYNPIKESDKLISINRDLDSIQDYIRFNQHSSTLEEKQKKINYSVRESPTVIERFPKIIIPKKRPKLSKKKKISFQNPQEGLEPEIPKVEILPEVVQKPKILKRIIPTPISQRLSPRERFEQIMQTKHDNQLNELKQMIAAKPKSYKQGKKKVTFQIQE